jgi:hypothetical protein
LKRLWTFALKLNRSSTRPPIQDLSSLGVEGVETVLGVLEPFALKVTGGDYGDQLI